MPIGYVTNGVHMPSWDSAEADDLWTCACGKDRWLEMTKDLERDILCITDAELWQFRIAASNSFVAYARKRISRQLAASGASSAAVAEAERLLNPHVLTLGFARRFATYKRANLLLTDRDRLRRLLLDPERPVQIVFAGKAHPKDEPGKAIIQQIWQLTKDPELGPHVVFIEDYDIGVGRMLVHGVDAWVNNPRRPMEACGTSGQKVVLNGGLNISVLDGWWAEAYDGTNGFAIGGDTVHVDADVQDGRDAENLYRTLEQEVVPLFYDRDDTGLPRGWVRRVKRALTTCAWRFSADRMVIDYLQEAYLQAAGGTSH